MSKWADYSFARPDPARMRQDGIVGVIRYLAPDDPNTHGKILTAAERDALLAVGLDIALNFEWYEGRCNEGSMAGVADAATAVSQAQALNYPAGKTIYFSHDTGTYDWQAIDAYFRSVRDGLAGKYRVGAYGSYDLITHLFGLGLIDHGWQTVAWSNGQRDPEAVIYQTGEQVLNASTDIDEVTSTDIGSWLDGPEENDLTPQQNSMLEQIFNQLPKLPLDLLTDQQSQELLKNGQAVLTDIDKRVASLQADVTSLKTFGVSVDYAQLAVAVADEIYRRMAS